MTWTVCKLCVMEKGLKGSDLNGGKCSYAFHTDKELMEHIRTEHPDILLQ